MADLITNLQSIYNTKLQIKEAIGTDSDVFSDYPAYISAMGDSGYTYVTTNGDHSVNGYAYVNVNVPGATEYDHIEISANSQVNVAAYNYAYVSVPVPPGYIVPEGTINIDTVGTHDVTAYANAYVDIQVPTYVFGYQTITNNGTTYASSYGLDGFTYVDVQVPTSGSSIHDGLTPYTAFTVDELISYMNENYNPGDPQTADALYVKGKIANVIYTFNAQYPSWRGYLTNDGTFYYETENPSNYDLSKDLYVYGCFWESTQSQLWDSSVTPQVAVGDEVIILAPVAINSNGRVGTQNGYLYSHQKPVTGQLTITQSGTYDVQNYVSAYVNVSGGGGADTFSVTGVWMANAISDGVNTYQMMNSNNTLSGGLDSYSFGTYVSGNIISIYSNDCLTKYQNGNEIYCEDYDINNYNSNIVATAGTFNWDATNQVVNPSGGFYWSEQNFGWTTRKNYNFTDDLGTTYRISAYDYNTYNGATANLIINWWEDPNDPGQRYAAIVGTDA